MSNCLADKAPTDDDNLDKQNTEQPKDENTMPNLSDPSLQIVPMEIGDDDDDLLIQVLRQIENQNSNLPQPPKANPMTLTSNTIRPTTKPFDANNVLSKQQCNY